MLEEVIAGRTKAPAVSYGQRVGRIAHTVAQVVAVPALILMLGGLLLFALTEGGPGPAGKPPLLEYPALDPVDFFRRQVFSAVGMMSVGLIALVVVPLVTVLLILVDTIKSRRWLDTLVALGVAAILIASFFLGRQ